MAAAKPIVASRIQGYSYVLDHGQQGLLTPPKDSEALADALTLLIQNPDLRREMGGRGRTTAHRYSWDTVGQQIFSFYQATLEAFNDSKDKREG